MNLLLKWRIGTKMSEWHEVKFLRSSKNSDNTHDFLLSDVGVEPWTVEAGKRINLKLKSADREMDKRKTYYGYGGSREEVLELD